MKSCYLCIDVFVSVSLLFISTNFIKGGNFRNFVSFPGKQMGSSPKEKNFLL